MNLELKKLDHELFLLGKDTLFITGDCGARNYAFLPNKERFSHIIVGDFVNHRLLGSWLHQFTLKSLSKVHGFTNRDLENFYCDRSIISMACPFGEG